MSCAVMSGVLLFRLCVRNLEIVLLCIPGNRRQTWKFIAEMSSISFIATFDDFFIKYMLNLKDDVKQFHSKNPSVRLQPLKILKVHYLKVTFEHLLISFNVVGTKHQ